MLTSRRRAGRLSHPRTFLQGLASGLYGLGTFNLDVRMLPRNSGGPAVIAGVLLIALWTLPDDGLGLPEAVSFIAGALFSAHVNRGPAPRSSYVYLWLLAGILAGGGVALAGWTGMLDNVSAAFKAFMAVAVASLFWAVGSAKIRRVAVTTAPPEGDRGQGDHGSRR